MGKKEPEFPSLIEQGKNLTKSAIRVAKGALNGQGFLAPQDIQKARMKKCKKCECFYESAINENQNRCTACGCYLTNKVSLAAAECPKGKWGAYENK